MKAKTLKQAIANIPDDANIVLEYSNMLFGEQFEEVLMASEKEEIYDFATNELDYDEEDATNLADTYDHIIHFKN